MRKRFPLSEFLEANSPTEKATTTEYCNQQPTRCSYTSWYEDW